MFKLKKSFGKYKAGKVFDSFGGLVLGIWDQNLGSIKFDNTEYFTFVNK